MQINYGKMDNFKVAPFILDYKGIYDILHFIRRQVKLPKKHDFEKNREQYIKNKDQNTGKHLIHVLNISGHTGNQSTAGVFIKE